MRTCMSHCHVQGMFKMTTWFNFSLWGKQQYPHLVYGGGSGPGQGSWKAGVAADQGTHGSPVRETGPPSLLLQPQEGGELGFPMSEVLRRGLVCGLTALFNDLHPTGNLQIKPYFSGGWGWMNDRLQLQIISEHLLVQEDAFWGLLGASFAAENCLVPIP